MGKIVGSSRLLKTGYNNAGGGGVTFIPSYQQYLTILLRLNQRAIRFSNAEQYC